MRPPQAVESALAICARGLVKRYGDITAVNGLDLDIRVGEFFGFLGPNGSGKTSTVHMLSSLVRPTAGAATVAAYDVLKHAVEVRSQIGVVFQESALDDNLSVTENLRFAGRLYDLSNEKIRQRSEELLDLFTLGERRDSRVGTLSGGMRRALDIARGVIHRPQILFLDEPTLGLDVPNRRKIWRFIERLRLETGMTVFLTTHYLEEAAPCDRVAFVKAGRLVKSGPPAALIADLATHVIELESEHLPEVVQRLRSRLGTCLIEGNSGAFLHHADAADAAQLQAELADRVSAFHVRKPNLNDVFLWSTQ